MAVAGTFILQLTTIYVPFLNTVFKTQPLTAGELAISMGMASSIFFFVEFEKWLRRRKNGW
jgi:Ca2+-transporting ATPase